jgi:large subunit ribosomal protein L15
MKHIGNISYAEGSRKRKKRIGRGSGSGHGGTSTRGHKGHQSRSGFNQGRGFEGGQMPLLRRVPKFGFTNPFRVEYQVVGLDQLQQLAEEGKLPNNTVTSELLHSLRVVRKSTVPVKILANGKVTTALTVQVDKVTESARKQIESVGGKVVTNE